MTPLALGLPEIILGLAVLFLFWGTVKRLLVTTEKLGNDALSVADSAMNNFSVKYKIDSAIELAEYSTKIAEKDVASVETLEAELLAKLTPAVS